MGEGTGGTGRRVGGKEKERRRLGEKRRVDEKIQVVLALTQNIFVASFSLGRERDRMCLGDVGVCLSALQLLGVNTELGYIFCSCTGKLKKVVKHADTYKNTNVHICTYAERCTCIRYTYAYISTQYR